MRRLTLLLLLLILVLASPALADGAFDILLTLVTGGPIPPIVLGLWGCHLASSVRRGWVRDFARFLTFYGALGGYWLGWELAWYRMNHLISAGMIGFIAPTALFFSAVFTFLPLRYFRSRFPCPDCRG